MCNTLEFIPFNSLLKQQITTLEQKCFSNRILTESFDDYIQKDYFFSCCAVNNGVVCGYICANMLYDFAEIIDLAVDQSFRRKHIAKKLMDEFFCACKAKGISTAVLEVASKNTPAIALYNGFGFKTDRIVKNYYNNPRDDAFCMSATIN